MGVLIILTVKQNMIAHGSVKIQIGAEEDQEDALKLINELNE